MKEVTLLLGENRGYNGLQRGKVSYDKTEYKAGGKNIKWKRVPAKHVLQVVDNVAKGMVATTNQWRERNNSHHDLGGYDRRFEVVDIKDIGPDPLPETQVGRAMGAAALMQKVCDSNEAVMGMMEQLTKAVTALAGMTTPKRGTGK